MECRAATDLVHRYIDAELGPTTAVEIDDHIDSCRTCRPVYERQRALQRTISRKATRYRAPQALADRIAVRVEGAPRAAVTLSRRWRAAASAATIALSIGLSSGVTWIAVTGSRGPELREDLVASHIRSLMADHLTDVASSDRHTVKPWFSGRIGLTPPVRDLAAEGFPLVGGRLDYVAHRPVAALVYRRHQHVINLFVMPGDDGVVPSRAGASLNGYNLRHWRDGALKFWAISDLDAAELDNFEQVLCTQP
jgi:anti-sigma factor RsiW